MSERMVCGCGRIWLVRRFALAQPCEDAAICLCGEILKEWNEAADYVFEPENDLPLEREDDPGTAAQAYRKPVASVPAVFPRVSRGR